MAPIAETGLGGLGGSFGDVANVNARLTAAEVIVGPYRTIQRVDATSGYATLGSSFIMSSCDVACTWCVPYERRGYCVWCHVGSGRRSSRKPGAGRNLLLMTSSRPSVLTELWYYVKGR